LHVFSNKGYTSIPGEAGTSRLSGREEIDHGSDEKSIVATLGVFQNKFEVCETERLPLFGFQSLRSQSIQ
jgi:hypothetical protein